MTKPNDSGQTLTKREYFASVAMQGLVAAEWTKDMEYERICEIAVFQADALIEALNNKE